MVSESIEKSKSVSPAKCLKKTALRKASKNFAKSKDNCLFIRYRHDKLPARDEVRLLHPNIIDVRFPRQKTAKFCHLEFENYESAIEALRKIKKTHKEELSVIQYIGKRRTQSLSALASKIKSGVQPEKNSGVQSENNSGDEDSEEDSEEETLNTEEEVDQSVHQEDVQPCACLHVSGFPDLAVKEVIQSLYPSNTKIEIGDKKLKGKRYALVHFESAEEATQVMHASKDVSVNGDMLTVKFHK